MKTHANLTSMVGPMVRGKNVGVFRRKVSEFVVRRRGVEKSPGVDLDGGAIHSFR